MQSYTSLSRQEMPHKRNKNTQKRRVAIWVSLGALVIIIPLVLVCSVIVFFQAQGINLPGVTIYEQAVGLRSRQETAFLTDELWNHDRQMTLILSENPNTTFQLSSEDLGYWVDPAATANTAYDIGRAADPLPDVQGVLKGEKQVVLPILYFDESVAIETLKTLAKSLTIPAKEASLIYQNDAWVALPGVNGQTLDIDTTLNLLYENAFLNLTTQSALLQMKSVSPVISDLN